MPIPCLAMQAGVSQHWQAMVSILDLLLRWAVLRFNDDKQQLTITVQQWLCALFEQMHSCHVGADDNEANVFLPCVCDKLGHKNQRVREGYNRLISLFSTISDMSRVVMFLGEVRGLLQMPWPHALELACHFRCCCALQMFVRWILLQLESFERA